MLSLYVPGDSIVHRLPAGPKLLALFAASTAPFAVSGVPIEARGYDPETVVPGDGSGDESTPRGRWRRGFVRIVGSSFGIR